MEEARLAEYYVRFMRVTKDVEYNIQQIDANTLKNMKGTDFENVVYDALLREKFSKDQISHSTQKFPDFVIMDEQTGEKIGIEVKKTNDAKWEVQGGSIFESLKNDIENIYILMGKFGGTIPEARLKRYEECLQDLKVTHSPRFYINLDLKEGEDYLTQKNATDLLSLSGDELNRRIRQLLRTDHSTWWSEEETIAFSDLSSDEKNMYLNDGVALFPQVFGSHYSGFTPWLVYNCLVWCGNVRDIFSAGGTVLSDLAKIYFSAIMNRVIENKDSILERVNNMTDDERTKFWETECLDSQKPIEIWIQLVSDNLLISNKLVEKNKQLDYFSGKSDDEIRDEIRDKFIQTLKAIMC